MYFSNWLIHCPLNNFIFFNYENYKIEFEIARKNFKNCKISKLKEIKIHPIVNYILIKLKINEIHEELNQLIDKYGNDQVNIPFLLDWDKFSNINSKDFL